MLSLPIVHLLDDWSNLLLSVVVCINVLPTKRASKLIIFIHYADMGRRHDITGPEPATMAACAIPWVLKEPVTSCEVLKSLQRQWIERRLTL